MAMAAAVKVALGSIAFAIFWVLAVFPAVPFLPIGRTAGSLLGALLMVIFRVITPEQAFDAIDLPILGLLFGTMVVSVYLEKADMFMYLGKLLSWKSGGSRDLLCRICIVSAISSALFTNDTTCVVLTEFVLKIARQQGLPPHPFLLALASSANIGSSATPIGNPQNLVIAVQSGISFGEFLMGVGPAMIVGVCVNAVLLVGMYWNLLSSEKKDGEEDDVVVVVEEDQDVGSHRFSPAAMSHQSSANGRDLGDGIESSLSNGSIVRNRAVYIENVEIKETGHEEMESTRQSSTLTNSDDWSMKWKRVLWKACVYMVTLGMLVSLLMGLNMSWTAITAALALVVLDFKDARPCLEKVSYSLLIFFCGMFITVEGFNRTGIPSALWDFIEPYAQINKVYGLAILAAVILLLSNVVSNVPTVLLLGGQIAATAGMISVHEEKRAWLVLAWVSTVAGNLSLLGSAANLIVCEQARRTPHLSYTLSFWRHLKFGFPSTLIVTAIGLTLIRG